MLPLLSNAFNNPNFSSSILLPSALILLPLSFRLLPFIIP